MNKNPIKRKLALLKPIFARAAVGDFSKDLKMPDEEDEFLDLFVGIQVMLEVIRDQLAELRGVNSELRRLNRIRTEFTSIVSHELRTPLNSIKEGLAIVLDGIDGPVNKDQAETLGIAKNNVDRLARMINNVLDYTKLEFGKFRISFEKTDVNALFSEVYRFLKPAVVKKFIRFSLSLPRKPVMAICDPDRIREVVINLVDNAVKFTKEKGSIRLQLSSSGRFVQITVGDTGSGIKKEDQSMVFKLFRQGTIKKTVKLAGSGIGLAVCRLIVVQHGGKISVKSNPGKGTIFTVRWPKNPQTR